MADAERAVNEVFDLDGGGANQALEILLRGLARDDHARKAERLQQPSRLRVVRGHLGGGVQLKLGIGAVQGGRAAKIRHDQGVDPCLCRLLGGGKECGQLAVGEERIEREIGLYAVGVRTQNGGVQSISAKVFCVHTGIELRRAEVNGVRASLDGGVKRLGRACGAEQLGQSSSFAGIRHR